MKYAAKRIAMLLLTMVIVSLLAFVAFDLISGDPATAMLGTEATPEKVAALREQLGLDRPLLTFGLGRKHKVGSSANAYLTVIRHKQILEGKILLYLGRCIFCIYPISNIVCRLIQAEIIPGYLAFFLSEICTFKLCNQIKKI